MIALEPKLFKTTPRPSQLDGTRLLIKEPNVALFDEMGVGKSKQVIDAAGVLYRAGIITTVIIVAPAMCRSVWLDPDLGEIEKHNWMPAIVSPYDAKYDEPPIREDGELMYLVTTYEYLRQDEDLDFPKVKRLEKLLKAHDVLLVFDESSMIKNHRASQTRACFRLRTLAKRAVILNGTPDPNGPLDLYSQYACLDKKILGFKNFYHFRAHHAVMGGYMNKQAIKYVNLEEIAEKTRGITLRRFQSDVRTFDPKIYSFREARLTPATWKLYKEMRDDMIAWLDTDEASVAQHAPTKVMRMAQMTSGFLGGLDHVQGLDEDGLFDPQAYRPQTAGYGIREIGEEKQRIFLEWFLEFRAQFPQKKLVVWCRFRPELDRLATNLYAEGKERVFQLHGDVKDKDREILKKVFNAGYGDKDPAVLLGQPQAGKFGLDFTASATAVYLSNDYNLLTRQQSEDRIHRPGQLEQTYFLDVLARGPDGQQTVDHMILKALKKKENMSSWMSSRWREELSHDE